MFTPKIEKKNIEFGGDESGMRRINAMLLVWFGMTLLSLSDAFEANEDVQFELYTRESRKIYEVLDTHGEPAIAGSRFLPTRPTRIFVHGYRSKRKVIDRYSEAFLNVGDYNFIALNWIEGASTVNYYTAKNRVKGVARVLAKVIDALVAHGMRLEDLTIVGHSLGCHISGRAAKQLKSEGKIAVIIALDPASVLFDFFETEKRLSDTDADYVQVIHTDSGHYSFEYPLGHADFYPNGGRNQPGCKVKNAVTSLVDKCSHVRSHALYLESLSMDFPGIQCTTYEEISKNKCTRTGVIANMGGDIGSKSMKPSGVFYLETYFSTPFMKSIENFSQIEYVEYFEDVTDGANAPIQPNEQT